MGRSRGRDEAGQKCGLTLNRKGLVFKLVHSALLSQTGLNVVTRFHSLVLSICPLSSIRVYSEIFGSVRVV